jgi:Lipoxygenase
VAQSSNHFYQWIIPKNRAVPPYVKGLPDKEGFTPWKVFFVDFNVLIAALGLLIAYLLHFCIYTYQKIKSGEFKFRGIADLGLIETYSGLNRWSSLQEFNSFFRPWTFLQRPLVAQDWDRDAEFGRQRLAGMNPAFIKKCRPQDLGLDTKFPVTDSLLKPFLGEDFSLSRAFADHRLFLLDYEILENITLTDLEDQLGRYPHAPFCLLYVDDSQALVPIAIQVDQTPSPSENPIYTPASPTQEWLAAKVIVGSADAAYQGIVSHLMNTHLIVETMVVATHRALPPEHLLWQLLTPHFFNTLAINTMARSIFLGRGGFFDTTGALGYTGSNELLSRSYSGKGQVIEYKGDELEFYKLSLPYSLESRDVKEIPNYHYRDDAQLIWDAIRDYVARVLKTQYTDPESLAKDTALQAWKTELIGEDSGDIRGLLPPEQADQLTGLLTDIDALIFIATNIIFTASAQHSALNFGQYDYAAWVPNQPFALYKPLKVLLDHQVENADSLATDSWLPTRIQALKQIILVKTLVLPPPFSSKSLKSFNNPFKDAPVQEAFQAFKHRLDEIERKIKDRNTALVIKGQKPYKYLLPSRIAQSIAI